MTADDRCRKLQETLAAKYPAAGLTFGYVGNVERWGDDRAWSFWATKFRAGMYRNAARFGYHSTPELDQLANKADAELEAWIVKLLGS